MPRLASLTSLRFFAALMIVIFHAFKRDTLDEVPILGKMALDQGVSFFFVLSGFILTYVYSDLQPSGYRDFFAARFARLWPAHIATLLLGFLLGSYGIGGLEYLTLNITMLQSWWPVSRSFYSYNAVSWSISTEFGFYLAFPLLIRNFRTSWLWKLLLAFLMTTAMIAVSHLTGIDQYVHNSTKPTYVGLVYIFPPARLTEFVLGMCLCRLFFSRSYQVGGRSLWTALEIAVIILAVWNSCSHYEFMESIPAANEYLRHSGSMLSMGLVVYVFACDRGFLAKVLSLPPFVFLGEISFSIYLLHEILLEFLRRVLTDNEILRHAIFWPLLFVYAAFLYYVVEKPLRSTLRRRLSKPQPAVAPGCDSRKSPA